MKKLAAWIVGAALALLAIGAMLPHRPVERRSVTVERQCREEFGADADAVLRCRVEIGARDIAADRQERIDRAAR